MTTFNIFLSLAADLLELAWLYLQLYALRGEILADNLVRWLAATPDGALGTVCGLAEGSSLSAAASSSEHAAPESSICGAAVDKSRSSPQRTRAGATRNTRMGDCSSIISASP